MNLCLSNAIFVIENYYIEILKNKVETTYGKKVCIANSKSVSNDIFERTSERVSATTIQRFFELISNKSKTSIKILDIFSSYANYKSWDDFKLKHKEENPISKQNKIYPDEYGKILFDICLKNHEFKSVIDYIERLPVDFSNFTLLCDIGQSLGKVIRIDNKARVKLLPELAKTTAGRFYFYENFVDIDYINNYYRESISKYYLKHLTPNNGLKYNADIVFAKSIEFLGFVKSGKFKEAIKCSYILFKEVNIQSEPELFLHPYPYSRLISIYLITEKLKKSLTSKKVEKSIYRVEELISRETNYNGTFVLAQLIMALNFCSAYQEVIDLYKKYEVLINNSEKSTDNYIPIINCVKNSYLNLGISIGLDIKPLDFTSLENIKSSKGYNILL